MGCLALGLWTASNATAQAPAVVAEIPSNGVVAVVADRAVTKRDMFRLLRDEKPSSEQMGGALRELINQLLLIKYRQSLPTYFEPPGLVDGLLQTEVRDRYKGNLAELNRELQAQGRTLADHRRDLVDGWILRVIEYELRESVTISPKQVRDYYMEQYGKNAGQKMDVVELSLVRVRRDATKAAEQLAQVEKWARSVDSPEAFLKLVEAQGQAGDGPQGLLALESNPVSLSARRAIDEMSESDRRLILLKAHKEMTPGKAEAESPPGSVYHYILYVHRTLKDYTVSLDGRRQEIRAHLANEAYIEQKRLLLEKARKAVYAVNYFELDKAAPTPPPPVPAPKPANP